MLVFRPLGHPPIARLWSALSVATIGDELFRVALVWLAVEAIGPDAAYLAAVQNGVLLLAVAFGGRFTDFLPARQVMVGSTAIRIGAVMLPVVSWWLIGSVPVWVLVASAAVTAALRGQFDPAVQSCLPLLARSTEELVALNGLIESVTRLARLIGPGLVTPLSLLLPIIHFMTVTSCMLVGTLALLASLPASLNVPRGRRTGAGRLLADLRFCMRHRQLRVLLLSYIPIDIGWPIGLVPGLAVLLAENPPVWPAMTPVGAFGALIALYGVTNILGSVIGASRRHMPRLAEIYLGTAAHAAMHFIFAAAILLAPSPWLLPLLAVGALLGGGGPPLHALRVTLLVQTTVPYSAIGGIHRVRMVITFGALLFGTLVAPLLYRQIGIGGTILLAGIGIAASSAIAWGLLKKWGEV